MITQFINARQSTLSPSTLETYKYHLNLLDKWLTIHDLDFKNLDQQAFMEYLSEHSWNNNSQYIVLCATRSFVRWMYGAKHAMLNVKIRRITPPQRMLTSDKLQRLLDFLSVSNLNVDKRNLTIIMFLADSGLRSSEVCGLLLKHVDTSRQICTVYGKGRIWEKAAFGTATAKQVERWLTIRKQIIHKLQIDDPGTLFFGIRGHSPGTPLTPNGLRTIFRKIGKRSGIGPLSPHDLRRTFCTLSLLQGANTRQVQILGRWSDIHMVEHYSREMEIKMASKHFPFPIDALDHECNSD